ncbi:hypothetical protein QE152_g14002 [Popillia japonica]|uniref:Uncharacterized protein n=1 Tax=Popillia japonica TaxID=7064 RepID=A0AAW1L9G9_POPJA
MQLTSLMDLESRSCWSDEQRHIELKLQLDKWRQDPNIAQVVRSVVHISSDISVNKILIRKAERPSATYAVVCSLQVGFKLDLRTLFG